MITQKASMVTVKAAGKKYHFIVGLGTAVEIAIESFTEKKSKNSGHPGQYVAVLGPGKTRSLVYSDHNYITVRTGK